MLYIFAFGDEWLELGFTSSCPSRRRQQGFWHNVHPPALCGRLDQCALLAAFARDEALEKALHSALAPERGEFYPAARLQEIPSLLGNALEPLLETATRQAEVRYVHLTATRALNQRTRFVTLARGLVDDHPDSPWAEDTLNDLASHYITVDDDLS